MENKNQSDRTVVIIMLVLMAGFIFGMKPLYQGIHKLKNGTNFNKKPIITEEDPKQEEDTYKVYKPTGEQIVTCTKQDVSENGTKTSTVKLYYSSEKLRSIQENITYKSSSDEYSNYILSEQNKYKQRKRNNLELVGYSIVAELEETSSLEVESVYLLKNIELSDVQLEEGDSLDVTGSYDDNIFDAVIATNGLNYVCEWNG